MKSSHSIDDLPPMPEYSSSSEWSESTSRPSLRRPRNFEYIPSTGKVHEETDVAHWTAATPAEDEVVDAITTEQKSHGLLKVAAVVAAGANSMGGVRKAVEQRVRQVGHIGGAVRQGMNRVPEVDPRRCLIATLAIWAVAVVVARMAIA